MWKRGLTINSKKPIYDCQQEKTRMPATNQRFQNQVQKFRYLGNVLTENVTLKSESTFGTGNDAFQKAKQSIKQENFFTQKKEVLNCYVISILYNSE